MIVLSQLFAPHKQYNDDHQILQTRKQRNWVKLTILLNLCSDKAIYNITSLVSYVKIILNSVLNPMTVLPIPAIHPVLPVTSVLNMQNATGIGGFTVLAVVIAGWVWTGWIMGESKTKDVCM